MADALPNPPLPADVDLRTFDDMPLDVRALRDSDTAMTVSDRGFRAAVMLWCAAWHQIPAGSLPNDARKLAFMAGLGRDLRTWRHIEKEALRGFYEASDGRLYHSYICAKAVKAWAKKHEQKAKADTGWKKRKRLNIKETGDAPASAPAKPQHSPGNTVGNAAAMPLNRGDISPLNPPSGAPAGSGTPEGSPDRTANPTAEPNADPEFVEVTMPTGAILRISRGLNVDEIFAPKDCPDTLLTRAQTKALRAMAIAGPTDAEMSRILDSQPAEQPSAPRTAEPTFDPVRDHPAFLDASKRKPAEAVS